MSPLFTKLSASYFWYFAVVGLMAPFLSVYLDGIAFTSLEIGEILAVVTATKVIGPTLWAMLSDKTGKQVFVIKLGSLLALITFCGLFFSQKYWSVLLFLAAFSLFWTAILPQVEVLTLNSIRRSAKIYARIRLWGSIGFILAAVLAGEIIARYSSDAYLYIGLAILIGLFFSSLVLKQPLHQRKKLDAAGSIFDKVFQSQFVFFILAGLFLQISFGPFYGFFALYLRDLDYPGYAVGLLFAIGVIAEIIIFIFAGKLFKAFNLKSLLVFSLFVTALRWYITARFANIAWVLLVTQCLHAFSFGLFHSCSMQFLQRHFNSNQQNRGQAIYIGGVYGIGGAVGAYVAGAVWQGGIGGHFAFYLAAAAAVVATLFSLLIHIKPENNLQPK